MDRVVILSSWSTVQSRVTITAASLHCLVLEQCQVNKHLQHLLILQLDGKERAAEGRLGPLFIFMYTPVIGCWQLLTSRDNCSNCLLTANHITWQLQSLPADNYSHHVTTVVIACWQLLTSRDNCSHCLLTDNHITWQLQSLAADSYSITWQLQSLPADSYSHHVITAVIDCWELFTSRDNCSDWQLTATHITWQS